MGLDRIEALVWDRNERSIRVLQRLGYRREALLEQSFEDSGATCATSGGTSSSRSHATFRVSTPGVSTTTTPGR